MVVRGVPVLIAPTRPACFLLLRLRFASSTFAIVFLFITLNPLDVAIGPDPKLLTSVIDSPRLPDLAIQEPTNQGGLVHADALRYLRRGVGRHCTTPISILPLTCKAERGKISLAGEEDLG
jgi:hypothetical protein